MLKSLESHFYEVVVLGPIPRPRIIGGLIVRIDKLTQFFFNKRYNREQNILKSIYYYLKNKINNSKIDIIFSASAGPEIAFIKTKKAICYLADATFDQLLGYYSNYSNFSSLSVYESRYISKKAINKSNSYVYPSHWAADFAIKKYKLKKEKRLGKEFITRKKQGFEAPLKDWFDPETEFGNKFNDIINNNGSKMFEYIDQTEIQALFKNKGQLEYSKLYQLFILEEWLQEK